jgi:hypothetical protein
LHFQRVVCVDKLSPALSRKNSFYSLVIGIDSYKHPNPPYFSNLKGCVRDAHNITGYLKELGVSEKNITILLNEQATRSAIKSHLRALAMDPRIRYGDPILVFYAGHGGTAKPFQGWEAGGAGVSIQMLIPHDFQPSTNTSEDAQGIPDITLAALFSQLAQAKGDNIVRASLLF